jgi:hypothetical protein
VTNPRVFAIAQTGKVQVINLNPQRMAFGKTQGGFVDGDAQVIRFFVNWQMEVLSHTVVLTGRK